MQPCNLDLVLTVFEPESCIRSVYLLIIEIDALPYHLLLGLTATCC